MAINQQRHFPSTAGFSLVEILLVIGVIAVMSLVAFFIYPRARDNMTAHQISQTVRAVISQVQTLSNNRGYAWASTKALAKSGLFPSSWIDNTNALNPALQLPIPYGFKPITFRGMGSQGYSGPVTDQYLMVEFQGWQGREDAYLCQRLVQEMAPGAVYIKFSTSATPYDSELLDLTDPNPNGREPTIDPNKLVALCNKPNSVHFIYP